VYLGPLNYTIGYWGEQSRGKGTWMRNDDDDDDDDDVITMMQFSLSLSLSNIAAKIN
jgi:hypothetical protein